MESTKPQLVISSIEGSPKPTDSIPSIKVDGPKDLAVPHDGHQKFSKILEAELKQARKDREEALEDRDRLFKILERRSMEIERLESDFKVMKKQLQSSIDAKCEAVRRYDEVQQKMSETEFKEKRMEQERLLMQNQLDMLSTDLTRNIQELQQTRKESSMRIMMLESKLHEKNEELNISVMHESQLRESNEALSTKVDTLSKEILRVNEEFSASMKKYQQELASKSRLVDLYKEKCEDAVTQQKDITSVVAELKTALKEATEEYGKLEAVMKEKNIQHERATVEQAHVIEVLKEELSNANVLLEAAKRENLEIAVEKLSPSAVASPKLGSRNSISQVYSMYINASEDLDVLSVEHEKLKETFTQVVSEIEEKAPEIQRTQLELMKLRESYQTLSADYKTLKSERLDAQNKIDMMMLELNKSAKKLKDVQLENKDLSSQVCQLLHVIEGKPMMRRVSGDFLAQNCVTFNDVKELQENNMKLIGLVRELTEVVEELENSGPKRSVKATEAECQTIEIAQKVEDNSHVELKQKLNKQKEVLASVKQKHEEEIAKRDKSLEQLKAQLDEVKAEVADLSATNFKIRAELEHKSDQLKLQQKNMDMTKRKLQSIEDKSRNSVTTVARLETSLTHLRDELQSVTSKLNRAEITVDNLTKENKNLIRVEAHLKAENDVLKKQQSQQASIMNSIETIKSILERNEAESSATKMAEKIEELTKMCEELEKSLEDEKQNFSDFEAQANAAIDELETENQRLKDELTLINDEVVSKSSKIEELIKKILTKDEESQSDPESDSEIAKLKDNISQLRKIGKRYKEQYLELKEQIETVKSENEKLKEEVAVHLAENSKINEDFEKEKTLMKSLLTKARGMITKLNEENEELKQQQSQDFVSCMGSNVDMAAVPSQSNLTDEQQAESKAATQKRQREEDDEAEQAESDGSDNGEKKAKVEEIEESSEDVKKEESEVVEKSEESVESVQEDEKIEEPIETGTVKTDSEEVKESDSVEPKEVETSQTEQESIKSDDTVVISDESPEKIKENVEVESE